MNGQDTSSTCERGMGTPGHQGSEPGADRSKVPFPRVRQEALERQYSCDHLSRPFRCQNHISPSFRFMSTVTYLQKVQSRTSHSSTYFRLDPFTYSYFKMPHFVEPPQSEAQWPSSTGADRRTSVVRSSMSKRWGD